MVIRLAAFGLGRGDLLEDLERLRRVVPLQGDVAESDTGRGAFRVGLDRRLVGGLGTVDVAGGHLEFGEADERRRIVRPDGQRLLSGCYRPFEVSGSDLQQQFEVGPLEIRGRQLPELVQADRCRVVQLVVQVARAEIAEGVRRQLRLHRLGGMLQGAGRERPIVPKPLGVDRGHLGQIRLRHLVQVERLLDATDLQKLGEVLSDGGQRGDQQQRDDGRGTAGGTSHLASCSAADGSSSRAHPAPRRRRRGTSCRRACRCASS